MAPIPFYRMILGLLLWSGSIGEKLLCQPTPFVCKGQLFLALTSPNAYSLSTIEVDPKNEQVSLKAISNNISVNVNAIGFRQKDNLIYGWDHTNSYLFRVDANGVAELLKYIPLNDELRYFGGDLTPNGRFLVLVGGGAGPDIFNDTELVVIDLESPDFEVDYIPLHGAFTRTYDIAFDPHSLLLYGFDAILHRMVIFDVNTGLILTPFSPDDNVNFIGALFFDPFGNLYGYGNRSGENKNTFFSFDKTTGHAKFFAEGPEAFGTDGCSCIHTIDIQKIVTPESTVACSSVRYSFIIVNNSGRTVNGAELVDQLPAGFTISSILRNPYGGAIESGEGTNLLWIKNMAITQGLDTLTIEVNVNEVPEGTYSNQAALTQLPAGLGKIRLSDNPATTLGQDKTTLQISGSSCLAEPPDENLEKVFAPNAFSPNRDGINDYFFLQTTEPLLVKKLIIFSRWGEMVFESGETYTNQPASGWNGIFKEKPAPPGTYTWKAHVKLSNGSMKYLTGDISILK